MLVLDTFETSSTPCQNRIPLTAGQPHAHDWISRMPVKKRAPLPQHILISFSVFCSECAQEIRAVTTEDRAGDMEVCPVCDIPVKIAVGIAVNANTTAEIQYTMHEMQKNLPIIHHVLSEWTRKEV